MCGGGGGGGVVLGGGVGGVMANIPHIFVGIADKP